MGAVLELASGQVAGGGAARQEGLGWIGVLFILACGIVLHLGIANVHTADLAAGVLPDTDSYTQLLRAEALREGRAEELARLSRLDAPAGLAQHWTRPFTLMIVLPARLLEAAAGLPAREAILWWGGALCPLLHLLAALAAMWAARAVWPPGAEPLAGLLVLLNPTALAYSVAGRADHHTLLLLCAVLALGAGLRALAIPQEGSPAVRRRRPALLAGAAAGCGVWVNPEALLILGPLLAAAAMAWWLDPADPARHARQGLRASLGALAVILLALVVEQPSGALLDVAYDRVSAAHAALVLAAALVFALVAAVTPRLPPGRGPRLLLGAGAAAAALLPLRLALPGLFGVSGGFDAGAMLHFVPYISEMRPVRLWGPGAARDVAESLGGGLAGLLAVALAWRGWVRAGLWPAGLLLILALAAGLAATAAHLRAGVDLAAPAAVAAAGLARALLLRVAGRPFLVRAAAGLLSVAIVLAPVLAVLAPRPDGDAAAGITRRCPGRPVADWLARERPAVTAETPRPVVLTNIFEVAPMLAWHTPYRFVASPYHRGGTAFEDTATALLSPAGEEEAAARATMARREARLLLLCRTGSSLRVAVPEDALERRLGRGEVPDWLTPVPLPEPLDAQWLLLAPR